MRYRRRQLIINLAAFLFLFLISGYRQISLHLWPNDPVRTYVLYGCYLILTTAWAFSIVTRVTQRTMRTFLLLEDAIILLALTLRFVQDTFLYPNILLMRVTGLWVAGLTLPAFAMGFYASLGIGQNDSYRIPGKWFLLLVPVVILSLLNITDELHHFVCYIVPTEPQPNLIFHPNVGFVLIYVMAFILMVLRIIIIYRKNRILHDRPVLRVLVPMIEPILMLFASFTFIVTSMGLMPELEGVEVLEFYAKIYYIEVLMWEFYIYLGLVPTNMNYDEIFDHSTVSMRFLPEGSSVAPPPPGREIHTWPLGDQVFVWEKDVSTIQQVIQELSRSAEALQQESVLLAEELKTRNEEAATSAKNAIYDDLTKEVRGQLDLMKTLSWDSSDKSDERRLKELYLLGTYVKRRCNLSLTYRETGSIPAADLQLCFRDMGTALGLLSIPFELQWESGIDLPSEDIIRAFEWFEEMLELEDYQYDDIFVHCSPEKLHLRLQGISLDELVIEGR